MSTTNEKAAGMGTVGQSVFNRTGSAGVNAAPGDALAVTRAGQKGIMVLITMVPFAAVIAAIWLLWDSAVSSDDLALFGVFYVICALGITVGFHRS